MYTRLIIFLGCLLYVFAANADPVIEYWETPNGIKVYFVAAPQLPMVDIQLVFNAGAAQEGDKFGLAYLTNSLLNEGAGGLDANRISFSFESLGAVYQAYSSYDSAVIGLRTLTDGNILPDVLQTLKAVITTPDFPDTAVERQKQRMLSDIQQQGQSPDRIAHNTMLAALYGQHPYGHPVIGRHETVTALSRQDVLGFYQQYYVAENAIIAIVGSLSTAEAKKLAADLSSQLPTGELAPKIPAIAPLTQEQEVIVDYPSTQTHILFGQLGLRRGDPDYFPLYVGNHILGGSGMVSRLFSEIREKRGLSYSVYSYFKPMRQQGPFIAGLQTRSDQVEQALKVLQQNVRDFATAGPNEDELVATKKNLIGGFPLRMDSNSKLLNYIAMIGFYDLPLDYLETFVKQVEAVSIMDIKDAFQRRLADEKWVSVMVGPVTKD